MDSSLHHDPFRAEEDVEAELAAQKAEEDAAADAAQNTQEAPVLPKPKAKPTQARPPRRNR